MSVISVSLPLNGTAVDISMMDSLKSFNVTGDFSGNVILEASPDGTIWDKVEQRQTGQDPADVPFIAKFARVQTSSFFGSATAFVSADSIGGDSIIGRAITVPTGNNTGDAVPVYDLEGTKTFYVDGNMIGNIVIEVSNNGTFSPLYTFSGTDVGPFTVDRSWKNVRARVSEYRSGSASLKVAGITPNSGTAEWTITDVRFFIIDNQNGDDNNVGFIDAADDADLSTAAPLVAIKTLERLNAIVPRYGNGRKTMTIARSRSDGALYLNSTGVTSPLYIQTPIGYGYYTIRATDTVATAGATAWKNDANDNLAQGGRIASGTNSAGYKCVPKTLTINGATAGSPVAISFTAAHGLTTGDYLYVEGVLGVNGANGRYTVTVTGASTVTLDFSNSTGTYISGGTAYTNLVTKADGSAAGFTADTSDTAITGMRARFDINSSIPNQVREVWANGTSTIIFSQTTTAGVNDVFYLEEPGVQWNRVSLAGYAPYRSTTANVSVLGPTQISGIKVATLLNLASNGGTVSRCAFVHPASLVCSDGQGLTLSSTILNTTGLASIVVGPNRLQNSSIVGSVSVVRTSSVVWGSAYCTKRDTAAVVTFTNVGTLTVAANTGTTGGSCSFARGAMVRNVGYGSGSPSGWGGLQTTDSSFGFNGVLGLMPVRIFGKVLQGGGDEAVGLAIFNSNLISNCLVVEVPQSASPYGVGVAVFGNGCRWTYTNVNGSSNTGFGIAVGGFGPNGLSESNNKNNTILNSNLNSFPNGIQGARGVYSMGTREGYQVVMDSADFDTEAVCDIVDSNGCRISTARISAGQSNTEQRLVQIQRTGGYHNFTGSTLAKYRVVKFATGGSGQTSQRMQLAQANSDANCRGVLGLNLASVLTSATGLVAEGGEEAYVEFDRSGGKPAPALGGTAYVSTATAGLAQADVPATAATNQKFLLGTITAIHPTIANVAAVQLNMSPEPVLA